VTPTYDAVSQPATWQKGQTMIPKAIHDIGLDDLRALIEGGVAEGKTIEYKREMPSGADSGTVPFLASVSSFANTSGGDFLIGVETDEGLPKAFPGVEAASVDKEKLRLEQILANGLEPRLPRVDIHPVQVGDGRHVLVVRAPRSWVAPHRVRKNDKFYGRNSAGKYPLDVGELRTAFTLSETIAERVRNFRAERIARIYGRETPIPLHDGGCMVFHLLPLAAFT
jgi:predicted HTH transcriptional regulator